MGQAVSNFFTTTVVDVAKKAWTGVVHGLSTFANWVGKEVKSFVTTVIDGIKSIVGKIRDFFVNLWHNVEEFTRRIFNLKSSAKDFMWTKVYDIGEGIRNSGVQHMRERLKEMSYSDVDSLTDDQVVKQWKEYMSQHPLSSDEQKELEDMLDSSSDPSTKMINGTGGYSKLRSAPITVRSLPVTEAEGSVPITTRTKRALPITEKSVPITGIGATSPQESKEFKHRKDHVITHVTIVLLNPEQLKTGLPKSASLAPDEVQELHQILSI
ncbi:hypothetical protein SUGI_0891120 [Cryptomeria japonica]|nr:hypothetical protein SUGI_0891120 [Cryptomeria japonica]